MTIVIVKISIPKVKTAVLTNLTIFGENSSHKASVCLRGGGGGLKRYLADFHLNSTSLTKGLPLVTGVGIKLSQALVWTAKKVLQIGLKMAFSVQIPICW